MLFLILRVVFFLDSGVFWNLTRPAFPVSSGQCGQLVAEPVSGAVGINPRSGLSGVVVRGIGLAGVGVATADSIRMVGSIVRVVANVYRVFPLCFGGFGGASIDLASFLRDCGDGCRLLVVSKTQCH